ncbi:ribosomal-processing cysteine protease Prp [Treponema primitia]|uniref:ribosomal-processing cysteine protease Prp n=1 Tax=Treponema primitia TaxID=88058 RepID=UPI00025556FC|nr:ribosomal-processing cysteine protease Prp [Treponema primitia]
MIRVEAALDKAGLLRSCRVEGHAGAGPKGGDIVCAAVSVLTRTALQVLSQREGITVRGEAPERGIVRIEIDYTGQGREFLSAAGAFLLEGLKSVAGEYPDYCTMHISTEE